MLKTYAKEEAALNMVHLFHRPKNTVPGVARKFDDIRTKGFPRASRLGARERCSQIGLAGHVSLSEFLGVFASKSNILSKLFFSFSTIEINLFF